MTRKAINPRELHDTSQIYSQAIVTTGTKLVYCAGQVGVDRDGNVVGGADVVAQCRQALKNLAVVLAESGARPADVARLHIYVVDHKPEYLQPVMAEITAFFAGVAQPAGSWIGVAALARPDLLIEIEATAVIGA